jgi:cellulose synthase (UDP-forming)
MAFPSINGTCKSWAGRARSWFEAEYYGPYLASFSYSPADDKFLMPNCTGSHYAVRTSALKAIGGIGPELDEDLSTTIMFASRGFKGVYSMDTIALGHGPETFESAMVQEFQWARSAIILFFRWSEVMVPNYKYFTFGVWMRYLTTLYFYLSLVLFTFWILAGSILSYYVDWCTDASQPCFFSIINLLLRTMPAVLLPYGHFLMCRKRGWLRCGRLEDPPPSILTSPAIWIYRALRVLWMSRGVLAGFQQLIFNSTPHFVVTPKGENNVAVLSVTTLSPLHAILVLLGGAFWLQFIWKEPDEMGIALYIFIAAVGCCLMITIIVVMHFWENGPASRKNTFAHVAMWTLCIGGVVSTAVVERRVIFNAATANLFVPVEVFPHEWVVISVFYGIAAMHIFCSAFVF